MNNSNIILTSSNIVLGEEIVSLDGNIASLTKHVDKLEHQADMYKKKLHDIQDNQIELMNENNFFIGNSDTRNIKTKSTPCDISVFFERN